jgi:hypothetical protein
MFYCLPLRSRIFLFSSLLAEPVLIYFISRSAWLADLLSRSTSPARCWLRVSTVSAHTQIRYLTKDRPSVTILSTAALQTISTKTRRFQQRISHSGFKYLQNNFWVHSYYPTSPTILRSGVRNLKAINHPPLNGHCYFLLLEGYRHCLMILSLFPFPKKTFWMSHITNP